MNLEGSVIGNRYKIIEKIGNGGMATVYKSLDEVLNRYVAIKILREEFTTDEEFIKRFNAEAQSAARLTHPNIVSVYDVGQEYNIYYIVMELIQGKTLKEIIDEDGKLPWKWSINVAMQIASALEMAHKNNIIHRDIKPHNIMITEDGVAKVTDFGIAKAVSNSTITAFGTTLGSVHYFSPEHARGGFTDAKSDIYSLGVVMYEMVTGKVPFDADTPVSIALKHMQEEPVEPKELNSEIPEALNDIIAKALRKDPNERYQNATEMIKDLKLALKKPQGGFVEDRDSDIGVTRRIPTVNANAVNKTQANRNQAQKNKKQEPQKFFDKYPKAKAPILIVSFLAVAIVIALIVFFIVRGVINSSTPGDVQVPNVVGLSQEEAKTQIESAKLKFSIQREEYNSEVEKGFVISQDPKYIQNYFIKEGSTVNVVISKGHETVKMPKVAGDEFSKAETALKDLGLEVEKIEEISKEVPENIVISQEIEKDTEIDKGTVVKLHVSKGNGKAKVTVPYVIGKNKDEAKKILTDLKLEVNIVEQEDTSKSDGVILKQSVDVDSTLEEGNSITLTVNKIAQNKKGTVNVKVKSIIEAGKANYNMDENDKQVKLTIKNGNDTVYESKVDITKENVSQSVEGKGNITIRVYLNDILVKNQTMDLNSQTELTIK